MALRRFIIFMLFIVLLAVSQHTYAACSTVSAGTKSAGAILYNSSAKVFQYCDDTDWIPMNEAGSGGGGCTTNTMGAMPEGSMFFNDDARAMQGCAGNEWRAMGPLNEPYKWARISGNSWL